MGLSYDVFTAAFLSKISEYEFISMEEVNRTAVVDGYLKRADRVQEKLQVRFYFDCER